MTKYSWMTEEELAALVLQNDTATDLERELVHRVIALIEDTDEMDEVICEYQAKYGALQVGHS